MFALAALLLALFCTACSKTDASAAAPKAEQPAAQAPTIVEQQKPPALELANTAVYELTANGSDRHYQVWVDVPDSYADSGRTYPVVFVNDALYAFPLVRSIRNLLGQHGRNIEDFILVGLPPQTGLTSKQSRSRDYTPSNPLLDAAHAKDDYGAETYGEAAAYRDYIEQQVFPLIAAHYRADMSRKVYAGHSLGGLFGSYVLLTRPQMFQSYILSSPSLWFDKRAILKSESAYAAAHTDLPARVMMSAGMYETVRPGPRYFKQNDMIGDMRAFERTLKAHAYPHLSIDSKVIEDEDHLTVFPAAISRGLLWALPGHGPYISG
jgi:predicted alpha/beta superfamily hydrolase